METPLEITLSTDEKAIAQVDLKLLGSSIESLVVEFDKKKFGKLLFLGSITPKSMR